MASDQNLIARAPVTATALPMADPAAIGAVIADRAHASSVFGEAVRQGETVIIPVARAIWGFGGGASVAAGAGSGGGGGMVMTPLGYISMTGGKVRYRRFSPSLAVMGSILIAGSGLFYLAKQVNRLRLSRAGDS